MLPGRILDEIRNNDRLLGGLSPQCARQAVELYSVVASGHCHVTTARTAEMAKLSENAFRDVNIAFANELSVISHKFGVDVRELIGLANLHPRVNILQPGPGVGGHCIAVDPWFIVDASPDDAQLIRQARLTNDAKPAWVVDQITAAIGRLDNPTIACLGLAYKPDIDDVRESPAIEVVRQLRALCNNPILVVEPNVTTIPAGLDGVDVELADLSGALDRADVVVALVAHTEFAGLERATLAATTTLLSTPSASGQLPNELPTAELHETTSARPSIRRSRSRRRTHAIAARWLSRHPTHRTLISAGTERMVNSFANANYLNKARQQPEKVKRSYKRCAPMV